MVLFSAPSRPRRPALALGPAGTGKTFLAVVQAVRLLQERKIERIILTRPAVEAGERLGFLPGALQQKVDPYLRPLYDALHSLLSTLPTSVAPRGPAAGDAGGEPMRVS